MSITNIGLDAVEAIGQAGTIAKASEVLGVTQTALTQRVKLIEAELGCSLFIRSRRGMKLTPEGEKLYLYAKERTHREAQLLRKLQGTESREPVNLRISGPTLQTQRRVFKHLSQLKLKHPEVFFAFDVDDSEDLIAKVKQGSTDFVITSQPPPSSLSSKKLEPSEFILVGPYAWRRSNLRERIASESIIDFNAQDRYTQNFLKHFKLPPPRLHERHFVNNTSQMIRFVEEGLGFAVFDAKDIAPLLKERKLCNLAPDLSLKVDWYLCWNNYGKELGSLLESFIHSVN